MTPYEAAREYLALGLHPIPIRHRSKAPEIAWERYQTERPLADEVDQWWEIFPTAGVGLVMGRGTLAVDLDGGTAAEQLLIDQGIYLPGAPRVQTPHGQHVYLSTPKPIGDRVGLLSTRGGKPQVDIKGLGYVVAPPSINDEGIPYTWRIPLAVPFPQAPQTLLDLILQPTTAPASSNGAEWAVDALRGVGHGQRDMTCTRLAGLLIGKGLDPEVVEALLEPWGTTCSPPFDRSEIRKCVRSIAKRHRALGIEEPTSEDVGIVPLPEVMREISHNLASGVKPAVCPTPFPTVNDYLDGGFFPGELIYLGARPGLGKTALALQISVEAGKAGHGVLIVSREMLNEALGRRMLAQESGVSASHLRKGRLDAEDHEPLRLGMRTLMGLPQIGMGKNAVTYADIATLASLWSGPPLRLIVVDYLQLIQAPAGITQRRLQVEAVSASLKALAQHTQVPILCLSSLARPPADVKSWRPTAASLRETGELEHDADVILFLHRPNEASHEVELIVDKQRDGRRGTIGLMFEPYTLRFSMA